MGAETLTPREIISHFIAPGQLIALEQAGFTIVSTEQIDRVAQGSDLLRRVIATDLRRPTLRDVIKATAGAAGIPEAHLMSNARTHEMTRPRQVAMYVAHRHGGYTLSEIALAFKRDHSTICHGRKQVERRLKAGCDQTAILVAGVEAMMVQILEQRLKAYCDD